MKVNLIVNQVILNATKGIYLLLLISFVRLWAEYQFNIIIIY